MRLCRNWGVTNFDLPIAWAAGCNHKNIVRLCREWGATDVDKAMACAACKSHESIVFLFRDWGDHFIDRAMTYAAQEGHESIVRLCRDWEPPTSTGVWLQYIWQKNAPQKHSHFCITVIRKNLSTPSPIASKHLFASSRPTTLYLDGTVQPLVSAKI